MRLKIVTPAKVVFDEEVEAIYAKAVDGEFGVLPRHIPMVTPLEIGVLHYHKNGQKVPVAVMGGLFSTDGEAASILSDAAELTDEIDVTRAQQAKERAEARLREATADLDVKRADLALARSMVRLKVTKGL